MITRTFLPALTALLVLTTGCGEQQAQQQSDGPPYQLAVDTRETMQWILEPLADVLWDSAGFIIDAQGEEDLSPTTEEAWNNVVYAAATLSEAGNLLMLPGRSAGDDWNEYAAGLVTAGKGAMDAALQRDAEALFDAGGNIYQVCRACHNQYWAEGRQD